MVIEQKPWMKSVPFPSLSASGLRGKENEGTNDLQPCFAKF